MAGTPDHPIAISPATQRVRVRFAGHTIADTVRALSLREASYPPVLYIPREDVDMSLLVRSDHRTHCPFKGDASYFSIGKEIKNAVWATDPVDECRIAGHIAFRPGRRHQGRPS
jgi:uncharacterized protein (DUF427 family)